MRACVLPIAGLHGGVRVVCMRVRKKRSIAPPSTARRVRVVDVVQPSGAHRDTVVGSAVLVGLTVSELRSSSQIDFFLGRLTAASGRWLYGYMDSYIAI